MLCTIRATQTRLLLILASLGLASCQPQTEPSDYFPLRSGLQWEYAVWHQPTKPDSSDASDGPTFRSSDTPALHQPILPAVFRIETLGSTDVAALSAQPSQQAWIRRTSLGTDYYLQPREDGIYRVAKRTLVELTPRIDARPRLVMPLPVQEQTSRIWSSISMPYLLQSVINPEGMKADTLSFPMTYRIVSLNETVEVPAGRFERCLLIEGQTELTLYADPLKGDLTIPITTREWYAAGVGLIKLERDEPIHTEIFVGGKLTMALQSFES